MGELTSYLKELLDGDALLADVWVRGEISNFHHHLPSGHMYFTLKDATACVRAVMFRSANQRLPFRPEEGMRVIAGGNVSVYERDGQYQLYVREMQPDGVGSLFLAFEQCKRKLAEEGLFDEGLKRPLPLVPRRVGVVTSPVGAAIRDVITVARRRFPNVHLVVSPVQVQGLGAAVDIIRGLELLDRLEGPEAVDVIILARGGGSIEELWAFNDEALARAIRAARHPVVTGIGHETDVTIADLVADRRAATPSNAAELAVPSKAELAHRLGVRTGQLAHAARATLERGRRAVETWGRSAVLAAPGRLLDGRRQRVDDLARRAETAFVQMMRGLTLRRNALAGRLHALSPLAVLGRGYALCRRSADGRLVTTVALVAAGEAVELQVRDGLVDCDVRAVRPTRGAGGGAATVSGGAVRPGAAGAGRGVVGRGKGE